MSHYLVCSVAALVAQLNLAALGVAASPLRRQVFTPSLAHHPSSILHLKALKALIMGQKGRFCGRGRPSCPTAYSSSTLIVCCGCVVGRACMLWLHRLWVHSPDDSWIMAFCLDWCSVMVDGGRWRAISLSHCRWVTTACDRSAQSASWEWGSGG